MRRRITPIGSRNAVHGSRLSALGSRKISEETLEDLAEPKPRA
jgi:hypothetical protein